MFEDDIIIATGWMAKVRQSLSRSRREQPRIHPFETGSIYVSSNRNGSQLGNTGRLLVRHMTYTFALFIRWRKSSHSTAISHTPTQRHSMTPPSRSKRDHHPSFCSSCLHDRQILTLPLRGVVTMNVHGCCTQALLFPKEQIPSLIAHLRGIGAGRTDTMIEDYADQTGSRDWRWGSRLCSMLDWKARGQ